MRRRVIPLAVCALLGLVTCAWADEGATTGPGEPDPSLPTTDTIALGQVTLRNGSGNTVGRVDDDGTIRNGSGNTVGRVQRDGVVRNGSGNTIGRVERDGVIRNGSGNTIGRVEGDGTIRNGSGNSVGRIDSDGVIRNRSGNSVGRAEGYSSSLRHMVAAVLFFGDSVSVLKLE